VSGRTRELDHEMFAATGPSGPCWVSLASFAASATDLGRPWRQRSRAKRGCRSACQGWNRSERPLSKSAGRDRRAATGRTSEVVVDDDCALSAVLPSTARRPRVVGRRTSPRIQAVRPRCCSPRTWTAPEPDLGRRLRSGSVPLANGRGYPARARWPLTYAANSISNPGHHAGSASRGGHGWSRPAAAPAASSRPTLIRIVGATVRSPNGLP